MAKFKDRFKKVKEEVKKAGKSVENKVKEVLESQDMRDLVDRVEHEVSNFYKDTKESVDKMLKKAKSSLCDCNNRKSCDPSNNAYKPDTNLDTDSNESQTFANSESCGNSFVSITGETLAE